MNGVEDGHNDVHDEGGQGRKSVVSDDLVQQVDRMVKENSTIRLTDLSTEFPEVSRSVLYSIVIERLDYKKLCACWVPKMLTEGYKT